VARPRRRFRVTGDTLYRDLLGEGILLQTETARYFGVDGVARRMWQLIVEHGDLDRVEAELKREYQVSPEMLAADLDRFVAQLLKKKLVESLPD